MRTIGLVGGVSWSATARYYQLLNEAARDRLGGLHSARVVVDSLDFADVARCVTSDDWDCAQGHIVGSAKRLEGAGAEAILICANSLHRVYDSVAASVSVPVIHIADVVGEKVRADGVKTLALVGTSNVMLAKDYRQKLVSYGISLLPPDEELATRIDRLVYEELAQGKVSREAERYMKSELTDIEKAGADAVILASTELEAVVDVRANVLPIYDCTRLHALAGAAFMLGT